MKTILLSALAFLLSTTAIWAQNSNMVIFTEQGERFYAIVNGLKMNESPVTNLKIEDLNQPSYKLKLIFEDTSLGELDKNIFFQDPGVEVVFMATKNKKGEYKLRFRSQTPVDQAPPAPPTQQVIVFGAPAPAAIVVEESVTTTTTTDNVGMTMGTNMNVGSTYEETTVTTTTTGGGGGTTESVNMNVGIDGFGMNVNVTASDGMGSTNMSTTTTTTTTTTTGGAADVIIVEEPAPCPAMGPGDFSSACSSIRSKSFEDSKLTLAKQVVRGHCVTSEQVRDMCKLFDFEDTKLEFAKYAYQFTLDQNLYYVVNDAFTFESTIEDLDAYIHGQH